MHISLYLLIALFVLFFSHCDFIGSHCFKRLTLQLYSRTKNIQCYFFEDGQATAECAEWITEWTFTAILTHIIGVVAVHSQHAIFTFPDKAFFVMPNHTFCKIQCVAPH